MGRRFWLILIFIWISGGFAERFWVLFSDKPLYSKSQLDQIYQALPEKTKTRRAKMGINTATEYDIPVNELYIREIEKHECRFVLSSKWLNGAVFEFPSRAKLSEIKGLGFVKDIRPVAYFRKRLLKPSYFLPSYGDPFYGFSSVPLFQLEVEKMHRLGYLGDGIRICLLDTGAKLRHKAFDSLRVVATWDFINGDPDISYDPQQDVPEQPYHGTYTLGVIGGYLPGQLIGVAYRAEFLLAKTEIVNQEIQAEESYWVRGLEWAESLGVDIVSSSLGYSDWYSREDVNGRTAITTRAANIAALLGVLVVTSAGNERGTNWNYIIVPADAESIISVGAVDQYGSVAPFSSPGPTYDGRIKPELVALGVNVPTVSPLDSIGIAYVSGTSMSTPLVAGACALLMQASSHLNSFQIRRAMLSYADQFFEPDTNAGWGIPSPYLSFLAPPTLFLKLYDADNLLPLKNVKFTLMNSDTVCTLTTNGRGFCRYYPSSRGNYVIKLELSPNLFFTHRFFSEGSGKEVIMVPVKRRIEERVKIYPNPFTDSCAIVFEQPKQGSLSIYSTSGELLFEFKGNSPIIWNGTNMRGERLASGLYIVIVEYEGEKLMRRVAIIR